jgi:glucose/arabinose dehydrogenase
MRNKISKQSLLRLAVILFLFGMLSWPAGSRHGAQAQTTAWPALIFTPVVTNLHMPVHVTHAGDGSGRLFIVEQRGTIRIQKEAQQIKTFLDIQSQVRSPFNNNGGSEEGLLSVAFPPNYAAKGYFYVYYTNLSGDNQVSRFHISADPDVADAASEELILYLAHPSYNNHNGGQIFFGPQDGYLYIGTGDGGSGGDPQENAENPASLLGKLLRIDVEMERGAPVTGPYTIFLPQINTTNANPLLYEIPDTNPFVGVSGARPEIWALGMRNPWRFSFDRQTGDLYTGDVGQGDWEEIDFQPFDSPGGENYGWDTLEGNHCYEPTTGCIMPANYAAPIYEYSHILGSSVTGGYVYRGSTYTNMQGIYFFSDYGSGRFWGLQDDAGAWVPNLYTENVGRHVSSFGEDEAGELYFTTVDFGDVTGRLYQLGSTPAP